MADSIDPTSDPSGQTSLASLREHYAKGILTEESVDPNPFLQFGSWFKDAQVAKIKEPNAMSIATVAADGRPSSRIVLLKEFGEKGFYFYTNYLSRKGQELAANPHVAATFLWAELERQVRMEGQVTPVDRAHSEKYFQSRPRGSRIGAWVSEQSQAVSNRESLEAALKDVERRFAGRDDIPIPDFWGGYCVIPDSFEFWQGRSNRLHDRIVYRMGENGWQIGRLWP